MTNVLLNLSALADGAAQQSTKFDFGAKEEERNIPISHKDLWRKIGELEARIKELEPKEENDAV